MLLCVSEERRVKRNDDLSTCSLKWDASSHNTARDALRPLQRNEICEFQSLDDVFKTVLYSTHQFYSAVGDSALELVLLCHKPTRGSQFQLLYLGALLGTPFFSVTVPSNSRFLKNEHFEVTEKLSIIENINSFSSFSGLS